MKTIDYNIKIVCELLKPFLLRILTVFMKIQLEIRKLEAENTLPEYRKPRFDSKLFFF